MAARKSPAPVPSPAPVAFSLGDVKPSTGILKTHGGGKTAGPNPLAGAALQSVDAPLMLPVANADQARQVENYLRRDCPDTHRMRVQLRNAKGAVVQKTRVKGDDGKERTVYPADVTEVHFQAIEGRVQRKYTVADIKAWALANGYGEVTGKVTKELRDAFKAAKGFTKTDNANQVTADSAA